MKIVDLTQNSPDWLTWRNTGLGASDAPVILGVSPWKSRKLLLHEKRMLLAGHEVKQTRYTPAMRRGHDLEPEARQLFIDLTGYIADHVCCEHIKYPWLKASLDGYDAMEPLVVEIKSPNNDSHNKALNDKIPEIYFPQLVHQAIVANVSRVLYVSYSTADRGYTGLRRIAIVEQFISKQAKTAYLKIAREFWQLCLSPGASYGATTNAG